MRRYIFNARLGDLPEIQTDVVIVGYGAAGLYAALNLNRNLRCLILNKSGPEISNSMYAQGGIAAVTLATDNPELHIRDTLVAGAGHCDAEAVKVLVNEGPSDIKRLMEIKVPFDRDESGDLSITCEGAHSCNRILHCGGDATGYYLTRQLIKVVSSLENVTIKNNALLVDIVSNESGETQGVVISDRSGNLSFVRAPKVILASGGIGRIYRNSTNASCATGDGIAAAYRAGATLKDMEFVQFHPTALIHPDKNGRYFLISEALRGEGAILKNRRQEQFMKDVHPLADLAPRDIVARAIISEMQKHDLPNVYLDITSKSRSFLEHRFPTIYNECMQRGIDIAINWIPVMPVQHYFMGGIKTDINGRTNLSGLYACGECACTGVHGANRLASNSLLECLVFGRRCAQDINGSVLNKTESLPSLTGITGKKHEADILSFRTVIRDFMTKKGGIIRCEESLKEAIDNIRPVYELLDASDLENQKECETFNMATTALQVLSAALKRKKSVGAHFRKDDKAK